MINFLWRNVGIYQIFFVTLQRISKNRIQRMNTFIGNIDAKADEKGRIFVPASYRKILEEMGSKHIVLRRDTDNECLIFYPEQVWNEKVSALRQALDEWDPEDQLILMQFMSDAETLETDSQGRVLLAKKNIEATTSENIETKSNDFVFVGMLDRFALWRPEVFASKKAGQKDLAEKIRARMKRENHNFPPQA